MRTSRLLGVLSLLAMVAGDAPAAFAGILRIETPITGQVVDAETRRPLPGARLVFQRNASCPNWFHGSTAHRLALIEVQAGDSGQFSVGGGSAVGPCLLSSWYVYLLVTVPGYHPRLVDQHELDQTGASIGTVGLEPIRYRIDIDGARRREAELWQYLGVVQPARPEAALSVRPVGAEGVFGTKAGMSFDRVAVWQLDDGRPHQWRVLGRDRATGVVHAWTLHGAPAGTVEAPAGWSMLSGFRSGRGTEPFFLHGDEVQLLVPPVRLLAGITAAPWAGVPAGSGVESAVSVDPFVVTLEAMGRTIGVYEVREGSRAGGGIELPRMVPVSHVPAEQLWPGAGARFECVTALPLMHLAVIAARLQDEVALFALELADRPRAQAPTVKRVRIQAPGIAGDVLACAGADRSVYVSVSGRGLARIDLSPWGGEFAGQVRGRGELRSLAGRRDFRSLAVTRSPLLADRSYVVYAVASDEAIYRFSGELEPDQRVEVDVSGPPRDSHTTR